ncbi:MAG: RimK family alpha-L-glutamate ligase [Candidatus Saccharibacteria bacterium]
MTINKTLDTLGSSENVSFPELGLIDIPARTDTGARTSTIWASNIQVIGDELQFTVFGKGHPGHSGKKITMTDFAQLTVTPSNGIAEERYVVKLLVALRDRRMRVSFTLADRSTQTYPILLGRNILKKRFIVDVSADEKTAVEDAKVAAKLEQAFAAKRSSATVKSSYSGPKLKIAILSKGPGNYSTKRIKEEALKHGHEVRVINYAKCYVTLESNKPVVRYEGESLHDIDVIIPRIAANLTGYGSSIVRQFEMQNVFTSTTSIAIVRSRDKLRSTQLLAKAGVGIPKTVFGRETADLDDILEQVGGAPVIIKVARGTHGNGVVLAETRKAAKAVMQAFYVEGVSFIVQEYVEESAGTDIRAFVVNGKVVASMKRQSLDDDFRSNLHQGGEGSAVKLTDEERKTAQKAAKAMGLPICGVDMMRSDRGPLVLEVNSSPGFGIEKVTGHNVAEKIIEYVEQNAKGGRRKDKVGA